jgi:protein-S-isoprenylcysteine O-methyltransferase Ste14
MDAPMLERAGRLLFRWRSFTPVPLVLVALPLLWRSRGPAHPAWLVAGLTLCLIGQTLRAWVIGQVPDGTSGQNEKLIATQLNTAGPYSLTRNPLYVGNLFITLGLCAVAHDPMLMVIVALLFWVQYRAIIAAEEGFLRQQFGAAFDEYRARVPRFWPRLARPRSRATWSWQRALKKEHNPAAAWIELALLLVARDHLASLTPYAIALGATAVVWLCVKGWKHRWLRGGFTDDLRRRLRETAR